MLCEKCKIREANIKYTEVINGVKKEHNLCTQCAKEMDFGHYSAIFDGDFPLGKILSSLLGVEENSQKEEKLQQIVCPTCGTSYQEFVENSCFGCQDCYSVFDLLIRDKIKKLQGSVNHTGKKPKYQKIQAASQTVEGQNGGEVREPELTPKEQLEVLKARLQEAIRKEEYEDAARYRDQIRVLTGEGDQNA
ncbi:MAG TPA: UvrB/UvrC motif-containing protein [Candidatus Cottocaccamicrobium excrementipullorum]|nr:UvrB/UvrC motif-containing protein [Candidatus Cottocaccamicrobium excrementipullorum]